MQDKSDSKTFEFALKCLNVMPRGAVGEENPSGEPN
jgi:hypothetical protein